MSMNHKRGAPSLRQRHTIEQAIEAGHKTVTDLVAAVGMNKHQVRWILRFIGRDDLIRRHTKRTDRYKFRATHEQLMMSMEAARWAPGRTPGPLTVPEVRWQMERIVGGDVIIPDTYVRSQMDSHLRGQGLKKVSHMGRKPMLGGENLEALYAALTPAFKADRADAKLVQRLGNKILSDINSEQTLSRTNAHRYLRMLQERWRAEQ